MDSVKEANKVSVITIAVNLVLSLFKLFAGIFARSSALISDAVHSASDVLSTFAVIAGVNIASRTSDKGHQYGHERIEDIFSIMLAVILFATGIGIGVSGIRAIIGGDYSHMAVPGTLALVAAAVSIIVKEAMYHYTMHTAKKINSTALKADAWHHRSDAFSSIGSLAGVIGAKMGIPVCDPIASVIICVFIIKAAWDIFYSATNEVIDRAADDETCAALRKEIMSVDGVLGIDDLKTRLFGSKIYVDVEIAADGSQTLFEAHAIAQNVHDKLEREFPKIKHIMVHINPFKTEENND